MTIIADQAIARMRSPRDMTIICVDVTNKCDLHCSNCTRLLENQAEFWDMTPDNFRLALRSLKGYPGIIAMIGGNPCVHRNFPDLCRIFVEEIPERMQRGLWSNNLFNHQEVIRDTFGIYNLNPHNSERGITSMKKLQTLMPTVSFFTGHSHHAPLLTAMKDLYPDEAEMWDRIQSCDINQNWSATIVQNKGELRAYFCEVAASFDLARGQDHGLPLVEGWWNRTIGEFSGQVKHFCPGCGVPARLKGHLDHEEIDSYSPSNRDIATNAATRRRRRIQEIESLEEARVLGSQWTNYNQYYGEGDVASGDGTAGMIYQQGALFHCLPASAELPADQSVERFTAQEKLPDFVGILTRAEDHLLVIGPGFAPDLFDLAQRALRITVLEPFPPAARSMTLAARLNQLTNISVVTLAAFDQNASVNFTVWQDPYRGMALQDGDALEGAHSGTIKTACIRLDDHFGDQAFDIILSMIGDRGDLPMILGAPKRLGQARLLILMFRPTAFQEHAADLEKMAAALDKIFAHCYAPTLSLKNSGGGCSPLLQHLEQHKTPAALLFCHEALS